jgi:predicted  nucleic acid-binding Zn-ribbon protein
MTVPGKGGRPRKWRSDADRVRAYRARQRGEEEPAALETALVDGDDLTRAVERSLQLQAELVSAIGSIAEMDAALQAERRRHLATQRKLDRARADLDGYRATVDRQRDELQAARDEVNAFRAELAALRNTAADHRPATGPNRAARREAAKRERRGH